MPLLLTTDAVGGVWHYTLELAAGLAPGTVLAVLGPACSPAQRAEAAAIPGLRLVETGLRLDWTAEGPSALEAAAQALAGLAAREGVAGVHLHAPALVGRAAWAVPVVAVAHSDLATWWAAMRGGAMPPDFQWRVAATAAGLARADAVVAPSRAMADALGAAYGARGVRVIHNGRRALPQGAGPRGRSVLTAGRLWDAAKGAMLLDRAAALLDAPVLAAGALRGPNGAAVAPAALRPLGTLDAAGLAQAYAASSVFASCARYEPFGLAVLEAAQAGLALVLADTPGFRELWDGAALFADPADAAGLAVTLRRALDEADAWGARARAHAARYSAEAMLAATLALHRELRAGVPGAGRRASPPHSVGAGVPSGAAAPHVAAGAG